MEVGFPVRHSSEGNKVLRGNRDRHHHRACSGFCKIQRRENALLVRDPEWSVGSSVGHHGVLLTCDPKVMMGKRVNHSR